MLGGCAVLSPVQTDYDYQAADGVNATFGELDVRGLVVISEGKDKPGTVIGQLVNRGDEDLQVAFGTEQARTEPTTVPRHGSLTLGEGKTVTLPSVPVAPGEVVQLRVAVPTTGENVLDVPVLPPTQYYSEDAPAPTSPSASPSATPTATPSPSASASS